MKVVLLLLCIMAFIVLASKLGNYLIKRIESYEKKKMMKIAQEKEIESKFNIENNYKEVLKKENCSSSARPYQDYNDKQNLTKYNHGTYRDEKGRFKSNKQWQKKEQETS